MPRKKPGRAVAPVKSNTNLAKPDQRFGIGDTEIRPLQLYRNPERQSVSVPARTWQCWPTSVSSIA